MNSKFDYYQAAAVGAGAAAGALGGDGISQLLSGLPLIGSIYARGSSTAIAAIVGLGAGAGYAGYQLFKGIPVGSLDYMMLLADALAAALLYSIMVSLGTITGPAGAFVSGLAGDLGVEMLMANM